MHNSLQVHTFKPLNRNAVDIIDIVHWNGHYDLLRELNEPIIHQVLQSENSASKEVINIGDSPCKLTAMTAIKTESSKVKREISFNEIASGGSPSASLEENFPHNCSDSDDFTEEITVVEYRGSRKYINPSVFENISVNYVDSVPDNIDNLCVYEVPNKNDLSNCKDKRPWCKAQSSKLSSFNKGPRLIMNCRGSYICSNIQCPSIADIGVNRSDFIMKCNDPVCSFCESAAEYLKCDARLIIEKDLERSTNIVKHYGSHTCLIQKRDRPEADQVYQEFKANPKLSRESFIRQSVSSFVEGGDIEGAIEEAQRLTDTKFIDNIKAKEKSMRRPNGHSFKAVAVLQEQYRNQDKFLIYKMDDKGEYPFVFKSSKKEVEILKSLDKDRNHPLSSETCYLDVLHSYTKGWKTYTLSYYDILTRQMLRLCTMEYPKEDRACCELFFRLINKMLQQYICESKNLEASDYVFNPYHLKDDEHGGNKLGMKAVLGEAFVNNRTSSCEFHLEQSVKNHKKYVSKESREFYYNLCISLKDSATTEIFKETLKLLESLISRQAPGNQPLSNALDFWLKSKHRWALCFRDTVHQVPWSSLAEPAQAAMKADSGKNLSLVDAVIACTVDSIRHEANFKNRVAGERSQGRGPTGVELAEREERRQIQRAQNFTEQQYEISTDSENETLQTIFDENRTHRPDKPARKRNSGNLPSVKAKRRRSIKAACFLKSLDKFYTNETKMRIMTYKRNDKGYRVTLEDRGIVRNVEIGSNIYCSCSSNIRADRKTCQHIIWCLNKVSDVDLDDEIICQVTLEVEEFDQLQIPETIPESLTTRNDSDASERNFHPKLKVHQKFDEVNQWFVGIKKSNTSATCSGCLTKNAIKYGDLHLYTKGLLYLHKKDKIVETTLCFCAKKVCVSNIVSTLNNIDPVTEETVIKKDPSDILSRDQKANLQFEGFKILGIEPIDFS